LQQVDTPLRLYDKPQNLFVASFIGSPQMNLLEGVADESGQVKLGNYHVPVDKTAEKKMTGKVTVGVRPENWQMVSEGEGLPIKVTVVEELGADSYVYGTSDVEGVPSNVIVRVSGRTHPHKGDTLYVTTDPHHVHVFDAGSGDRLSD
jgi:multiple sugar transport system ATP-binding protein